jgi:hypothetical protein
MSRDSAAFAWLGIFVLINLYWISYDMWAWRTKHRTMTGQMQNWLHAPVAGPLIFGFLLMIVGAFFYHMLVKAAS